MSALFSRVAQWTARQTGRASTFVAAFILLVVWGATGPVCHFDDTWQLVANTATSLITFLMVFLLQHSQTRDTSALMLKIDELIRSHKSARDEFIGLETRTDEEIAVLKSE